MRITQAGIYVLIQKYGIEGLIVPDAEQSKDHIVCTAIASESGKEEAMLKVVDNGVEEHLKVRLFDHLKIEIKAEIIEFRRSINLHFRGSLNVNAMSASPKAKDEDLDLAQAKRSKKK